MCQHSVLSATSAADLFIMRPEIGPTSGDDSVVHTFFLDWNVSLFGRMLVQVDLDNRSLE